MFEGREGDIDFRIQDVPYSFDGYQSLDHQDDLARILDAVTAGQKKGLQNNLAE